MQRTKKEEKIKNGKGRIAAHRSCHWRRRHRRRWLLCAFNNTVNAEKKNGIERECARAIRLSISSASILWRRSAYKTSVYLMADILGAIFFFSSLLWSHFWIALPVHSFVRPFCPFEAHLWVFSRAHSLIRTHTQRHIALIDDGEDRLFIQHKHVHQSHNFNSTGPMNNKTKKMDNNECERTTKNSTHRIHIKSSQTKIYFIDIY